MSSIRLAGIVKQSITDGPGLRFTLFTQGCPHRCDGCHNPETWACEGGKDYETEELLRLIDSNPLLKGVTLSGGEPLIQAAQLLPLAKELKKRGKDIVCYTGFVLEDLLEENNPEIIQLLSAVSMLVDGPYIKEKRDLTAKFRGSSNQRLINLPETLLTGEIILFED